MNNDPRNNEEQASTRDAQDGVRETTKAPADTPNETPVEAQTASDDNAADTERAKERPPTEDIPDTELKAAIEAMLFVADGPLTAAKIAAIINAAAARVRRAASELAAEYERDGRGFRIEEIAAGYQMLTDPRCVECVKALFRKTETSRITAAMLETLAIIAYKQPILRADIEAIRGVQAGPIVRSLMEKGLVRISGRADTIGKPFLYGTTRKFLEHFGLRSVDDLPKVKELSPP